MCWFIPGEKKHNKVWVSNWWSVKNVGNVIVTLFCLFFASKGELTFSDYLWLEKARSFYTRSSVDSRKGYNLTKEWKRSTRSDHLVCLGFAFLLTPMELNQLKNIWEKENFGIKFDIAVCFNKKAKSWHVHLFCDLQEDQRMTSFIFQWKKWNASAGPQQREGK